MDSTLDIIHSAKKTLLSESNTISKLIEYLDQDFEDAIKAISACKGRLIVTGIGKSAIIAQKIVATLNSTGTPSAFLHAAEAVHGDLGMVIENDLVLCISKSGNSPEIKNLMPIIKRFGNLIIGMTSNKNSILGKYSDFIIHSYITEEACPNKLAPTNSTTAQLVLGDAIAVCLMNLKKFRSEDFAKYHPGGTLGKQLTLTVGEILDQNNLPEVSESTSFKDVIIEITEERLGATAVLNQNKLVGIITDGDIRRILNKNSNFEQIKAKDMMNSYPKSIPTNTLVSNALKIMEANAITQLIVIDQNKYKGIIHLHEILKQGIL